MNYLQPILYYVMSVIGFSFPGDDLIIIDHKREGNTWQPKHTWITAAGRGSVNQPRYLHSSSVRPSVRPSLRPSVRPSMCNVQRSSVRGRSHRSLLSVILYSLLMSAIIWLSSPICSILPHLHYLLSTFLLMLHQSYI